jgi:hypothetical protein
MAGKSNASKPDKFVTKPGEITIISVPKGKAKGKGKK